jgi:hypothetical protein
MDEAQRVAGEAGRLEEIARMGGAQEIRDERCVAWWISAGDWEGVPRGLSAVRIREIAAMEAMSEKERVAWL